MIFSKLMGEFVDIIEWMDDSRDTMVWRSRARATRSSTAPSSSSAKARWRCSSTRASSPTSSGPARTRSRRRTCRSCPRCKGWKYGFESPFKAEVYFVNTRRFTDLKWGTKNPVIVRDPEFGTVRLRAFGTYAIRIKDPAAFLREVVRHRRRSSPSTRSASSCATTSSRASARSSPARGIPVLDLAGNHDELGKIALRAGVAAASSPTTAWRSPRSCVENISLPAEVEQAMDKRTTMGVIGDLDKYTQFQAAEAIGPRPATRAAPARRSAWSGHGLGQQASPWGSRPSRAGPGRSGRPASAS